MQKLDTNASSTRITIIRCLERNWANCSMGHAARPSGPTADQWLSARPEAPEAAVRNLCLVIGSTSLPRDAGAGREPAAADRLPWPAALISFCPRSTLSTKNPSMTRVRINYDGWLSLPTAVRRKLGLTTGDQLALSDGGILLRPVRSGAAGVTPAPVATAEPSVRATPPAAAAAA